MPRIETVIGFWIVAINHQRAHRARSVPESVQLAWARQDEKERYLFRGSV